MVDEDNMATWWRRVGHKATRLVVSSCEVERAIWASAVWVQTKVFREPAD